MAFLFSSSSSSSYSTVLFIFTIIACLLLSITHFTNAAPHLLSGLKPQYHHHNPTRPSNPRPLLQSNQTQCNLFMGTWVYDDSYLLYQSSDCPIIDPEFNCQLYGRPDSDYLKYRWKPATCELPRFDGMEFLVRMRGKSVMFAGDSLGRDQWESLVCMVYSALPRSSPTQFVRGDPLSSFEFLDYAVTISFYRAPFLVDIDVIQGKRVLKLDDISENGNAWRDVDVLMFNTGHWWTHKGSDQGWDYLEVEGMIYQDMDRLTALDTGLRTWARWVDTDVDRTRTSVFFQSISPTHYSPADWSSGAVATLTKSCYGETAPASGVSYPAACVDQMRVVESVLSGMAYPAHLLDITMLSAMRKDGHPSIYRGDLSPTQRANPDQNADCSHWCLPGLPDTWNQLFYTSLFYLY